MYGGKYLLSEKNFFSLLMLDVKLDYGSFGITPAMVDIKNYSKQVS